jgi:hypothetical protein
MKEMRGKKITGVDGVHGKYSDLWEKIFLNQFRSWSTSYMKLDSGARISLM